MRSEALTPIFLPLSDQESGPKKAELSLCSSYESIFERIKVQLMMRLGNEVYSSWFGRLKLEESVQGIVRISVPTAFLRSWISNHYLDLILQLWKEEEPTITGIEIVVRSATRNVQINSSYEDSSARKTTPSFLRQTATGPKFKFDKPFGGSEPSSLTEMSRLGGVLGSPLNSRYRFDSFIEGAPNRVAFAAARSISESPSNCSTPFNPLFLYASVGLGKTHLLQAIAAKSLERSPKACVVYLTAEYFMWRFATAIRDNDALTFKEQLRDIDLLIIDDMQFLQGKSIQNEFCHLLNMLLDSARQVVVAADRPPSDLESLEPRVLSRLVRGVALEIGAPDYDMRLNILRQRLASAKETDSSLDIPEEILAHIAKTITDSGRDLEGALNQLLFRHSFEPNINIDRIDDILRHIYKSGEPKRIRIEDIQRIVAQHYNVSRIDLLSNRRTRLVVKPRQIAMYLCKIMTPRSLPEIGRRFGGRDHTTALHAIRKIEELSGKDEGLAKEIELLRRLILDQA